MSMTKTASATTRKRGRGVTAEARKYSRAAFSAWDTRRANAAKARKAAKKAVATKRRRASS